MNITVKQAYGADVKPFVDAFYKKNGSQGEARKEDLFFIAYDDQNIVGCVRFCVEEEVPLLRTMYVDTTVQKHGIGRLLLEAFRQYLDNNKIKNVYCLPYSHLENFYGIIDFEIVETKDVPNFLVERKINYEKKGKSFLYMRRL